MLKFSKFIIPSVLFANKTNIVKLNETSHPIDKYVNEYFRPTHLKYKFGTLSSIQTTITRSNKNDEKIELLHSDQYDNPACIEISHNNILFDEESMYLNKFDFNKITNNTSYIYALHWYHFGVKYRKCNHNLPAEIGFFPNHKIWFEAFYDENGKLHSYNDNPSYVEYQYSNNLEDTTVSEQRWHNHGVLIKSKFY